MLARHLCRESANLVTANTALANAPITLRLVNVDRHLVRPNVLGMVRPLIQLVKNVALLIVTKPAVIMELTLAQTVAAAHVNVAHQPPPPALHQVVALLPVDMEAAVAEEVHLALHLIQLVKELVGIQDTARHYHVVGPMKLTQKPKMEHIRGHPGKYIAVLYHW